MIKISNEIQSGMIASIFTVVLVVLAFLGTMNYYSRYTFETATNIGYYERSFRGDTFSDLIADICVRQEKEIEQVYCVNRLFNYMKIEYDDENRTNGISLRYPYDTFKRGGVCRDYTNFYCSIFKKMDIRCEPDWIKGMDGISHMYAKVIYDEGYCNLDGHYMDCFGGK